IMVVSQGEPYSPKPPPWAGGSTVYGVQSVILLKGLLADCCPVLGLVARANHQQFRAWSGRLRDRLSAPRERKLLGSLSFCVVNRGVLQFTPQRFVKAGGYELASNNWAAASNTGCYGDDSLLPKFA